MNRVYPPVRGATGRVLRDLARSFAREGWQVTVITTGPDALVERDGAVKVIRIKAPERPSNIFSYLWIWVRIVVEALKLPATHLLVTMTDPPLLVVAGAIVKRFKKNRHIHWCQDLYPDVLSPLGMRVPGFILNALQGLSRRGMKAADKVIVIGRCVAWHLSCDGFDPKQITVIPNWPDFELLRPEGTRDFNGHLVDQPANDLMEDDSAPGYREHAQQVKHGPKFRVLYAGNIGRAHPIETIMAAAEQINNDEHNDIEFVFVGDGPNYDEIAAQRSKRHLDNIRLLPFQPPNRLKDLMESGDVHLISMKEDVAGMVVPSKLYSALAAHRPCVFVGPAHSEVAKVITDFKAGSVIAQGQAEALANEVRQLRHDSDKWFKAHEGAVSASQVFVPRESINAWIERAWTVVEPDMRD
jgi:colanic acid biosynthesis glycosyl transferase WcaI